MSTSAQIYFFNEKMYTHHNGYPLGILSEINRMCEEREDYISENGLSKEEAEELVVSKRTGDWEPFSSGKIQTFVDYTYDISKDEAIVYQGKDEELARISLDRLQNLNEDDYEIIEEGDWNSEIE